MTIHFQYLGILSETIGVSSESVDTSGTLKEIMKKMAKVHPAISETSFILSVNGVITHEDADIQEGDTVSLIPPPPGG